MPADFGSMLRFEILLRLGLRERFAAGAKIRQIPTTELLVERGTSMRGRSILK